MIPGSPRLFSMMGAPIRNDEAGMRPVRTTCQNDKGEKSLTPGGHDGLDLVLIDADHGLAEILGQARKQVGILPVGGGLHDGGARFGPGRRT